MIDFSAKHMLESKKNSVKMSVNRLLFTSCFIEQNGSFRILSSSLERAFRVPRIME